ncbi:MAG: hypothetical protein K0S33_3444, partial [Bacteroidetes bacterium]|nr:hypothetical protein [Bacteroidota bacterium]
TWTVTATDVNACSASINFTITEPSQISFTASSQTNISCFGGNTGAFEVNAAVGGTGGFIYDWSPGNPTGDGTTSVSGLTAGTWTVTATDANACSEFISFTITEPSAITSTLTVTNCDTYTLNGTSYTTGGTYTQVLAGASATGCDSTITLNLTILQSTASALSAIACDSYTLNGTTYNTSGTYTQNLTNAAGCDSILTLNLTVNQSTTSTLNETVCSSYTLNGTTYTSSGTYTQSFTNAAGCDSTLTLNLTVNQPTTSTLNETACSSYTLNGTTYNASGIYTQSLTNAAGCDSTLTLNLIVNQPTMSSFTEVTCGSYTLNGTTYTSSGTYTQSFMNAAGCDSTLTLNLTVNQPTTSILNETACSSYTLNGTTYTSSGTYTQNLTNAAGCDSIVTLNLTVATAIDITTSTVAETITATATGAAYQWLDCDSGSAPILNETNQSYTATANGNYAVVVTVGSCSDTSACVNIAGIGIRTVKDAALIRLYPNPSTSGIFTLETAKDAVISISTSLGAVILEKSIKAGTESIDLHTEANGVYFMQLRSEGTTQIIKIVKQE